MRRFFVAVGLLVSTLLLAWGLSAQDVKSATQQVKDRQKAEIKALQLKHKFAKEALKEQDIPKSMRIQMRNEMKRDEENLRQRHKHEREELKDRQRVMNDVQPG